MSFFTTPLKAPGMTWFYWVILSTMDQDMAFGITPHPGLENLHQPKQEVKPSARKHNNRQFHIGGLTIDIEQIEYALIDRLYPHL